MIRETKTENGYVRGLQGTNARITVFNGIPFAAPPVGELRWQAPQPAANWDGVRECYKFAPISMQDTPGLGTDIYCREWHVDPEIPMDEDCLYLNVWTPAKKTDEKLPVLVWYFGGGFQWGYPAEMEFDGEHLAKKGIVVVSVNYRLGAFGFMTHPEISERYPQAPANFGNLDQQAGLKWVVRNIENFGGDPKNITIAGQSAGGGSTLSQLTCKENFGLLQKAIIMSGVIRSPYMKDTFITPAPLKEVEKKGLDFFEFLGVKTLDEARKIDAVTIRNKYGEFAQNHPRFAPCIDGKFMQEDPFKAYIAGRHAHVPVMSGNTSDEFPSILFAANEDELKENAKQFFGDDTEKFLAFDEAHVKFNDKAYAPLSGIECSVKGMFLKNEENGYKEPGYYYRFAPDIPGWDNPGTFHSVDLWFFFDNLDKCWRPFVGRHYDLARQMSNYWVNFIATGDPNGKDVDGTDMPVWKPYCKDCREEMEFTPNGPEVKVGKSEFKQFIIDQLVK